MSLLRSNCTFLPCIPGGIVQVVLCTIDSRALFSYEKNRPDNFIDMQLFGGPAVAAFSSLKLV